MKHCWWIGKNEKSDEKTLCAYGIVRIKMNMWDCRLFVCERHEWGDLAEWESAECDSLSRTWKLLKWKPSCIVVFHKKDGIWEIMTDGDDNKKQWRVLTERRKWKNKFAFGHAIVLGEDKDRGVWVSPRNTGIGDDLRDLPEWSLHREMVCGWSGGKPDGLIWSNLVRQAARKIPQKHDLWGSHVLTENTGVIATGC